MVEVTRQEYSLTRRIKAAAWSVPTNNGPWWHFKITQTNDWFEKNQQTVIKAAIEEMRRAANELETLLKQEEK